MSRICPEGFSDDFIYDLNMEDAYGVIYTQHLFSGRYKCIILWYLKSKKRRYTEIKKFLDNISQGSLTKQLRELEEDGLVNRTVFPEVPSRVEYSLSEKGIAFLPIIELMEKIGEENKPN
ncbi:transcriptional regulator [Staphylococcus equorum]|uniref:winged helix-turn-helix transcriptional regulator n=1 Tax=Staphylococcus equorum TaxID=246432 RepID=UPI000D1C38AA|nr:helix-turn-helix domain-containing protein [Staphylococcus equorum]PTE82362.1 transcriptional regulator [Staphylococcus equorum]PTF10926.1 transcriptional regulator [Staphylococcus equorum]